MLLQVKLIKIIGSNRLRSNRLLLKSLTFQYNGLFQVVVTKKEKKKLEIKNLNSFRNLNLNTEQCKIPFGCEYIQQTFIVLIPV